NEDEARQATEVAERVVAIMNEIAVPGPAAVAPIAAAPEAPPPAAPPPPGAAAPEAAAPAPPPGPAEAGGAETSGTRRRSPRRRTPPHESGTCPAANLASLASPAPPPVLALQAYCPFDLCAPKSKFSVIRVPSLRNASVRRCIRLLASVRSRFSRLMLSRSTYHGNLTLSMT